MVSISRSHGLPDISPGCVWNRKIVTGNVWNGEFYKKLRRIFYSGYIPESCLKCGLIESGNLHYLTVDADEQFYSEPQYKIRQKKILKELLSKESE